MASFKVNIHDSRGQRYAPRIRDEEWESFKPVLEQLHCQRIPRKTMLERLWDEYDFKPSFGQLQAKMKQWKFRVYGKENVASPYPSGPAGSPRGTPSDATTEQDAHGTAGMPHLRSTVESNRKDTAQVLGMPDHKTAKEEFMDNMAALQSKGLRADYFVGDVAANAADPRWMTPSGEPQCAAMLRAADYYYAVQAYQPAFSLYRTVYHYRRKEVTNSNNGLLAGILSGANAAVSEHQRNIMQSLISEIGESNLVDEMNPSLLRCLQTASLSLLSADPAADTNDDATTFTNAVEYMIIQNAVRGKLELPTHTFDSVIALKRFEQSLMVQEQNTKLLTGLLSWSEQAIANVHHELDEVFVGDCSCEDEFFHRVSQNLSAHLLHQWYKCPEPKFLRSSQTTCGEHAHPCAFIFHLTQTETITALACMVVNVVYLQQSAGRDGGMERQDFTPRDLDRLRWFNRAAKMFRRAIRWLLRENEISRCEFFLRAYVERFYATAATRQRVDNWSTYIPVVVDSLGMALARGHTGLDPHHATADDGDGRASVFAADDDSAAGSVPADGLVMLPLPEPPVETIGINLPTVIEPWPGRMSPPLSEDGSMMSFVHTHLRIQNQRTVVHWPNSGATSPCDAMSLGNSADWRSPGSEFGSIFHVLGDDAFDGGSNKAHPPRGSLTHEPGGAASSPLDSLLATRPPGLSTGSTRQSFSFKKFSISVSSVEVTFGDLDGGLAGDVKMGDVG